MGTTIGVIKGDARSLDYGSHNPHMPLTNTLIPFPKSLTPNPEDTNSPM